MKLQGIGGLASIASAFIIAVSLAIVGFVFSRIGLSGPSDRFDPIKGIAAENASPYHFLPPQSRPDIVRVCFYCHYSCPTRTYASKSANRHGSRGHRSVNRVRVMACFGVRCHRRHAVNRQRERRLCLQGLDRRVVWPGDCRRPCIGLGTCAGWLGSAEDQRTTATARLPLSACRHRLYYRLCSEAAHAHKPVCLHHMECLVGGSAFADQKVRGSGTKKRASPLASQNALLFMLVNV